jgi:LacI family transcriptional regulator
VVKSSPSLRDVAQSAGVSLGTASRALNNKSNVLPATRALVLKAAADIGYKLQVRLPTSIVSKLNTVGAVVKRDPGEYPRIDPFNYAILCGVEDECERLGLNLMYSSLPVNESSYATTWSPLLESDDIDGLIIIGTILNDSSVTSRIPRRFPIVIIDAFATDIEYDAILIDNLQGAYVVVQHLIEQGHTRIGLIGSSTTNAEHPSITRRREGYLKALNNYGIRETFIEDSCLHSKDAYHATIRLLNRSPEITAIFGCSDDVAQQVIQATKDTNRHVPEDVSVVGFDDAMIAMNTQPPLTTMRVVKEFMGTLAVRQLYERALNLDRPSITTIVGTSLIVRESVTRVISSEPA